jgi:hypothetical protein
VDAIFRIAALKIQMGWPGAYRGKANAEVHDDNTQR